MGARESNAKGAGRGDDVAAPAGETSPATAPAPVRAAARELDVLQFLTGADFLRRLFERCKAAEPKTTYRSFAEALGFGPTNYLHLLCKGTRPLAPKAAVRIAESLALPDREAGFLLALARYECARGTAEREIHFEEIVRRKGRSLPDGLPREQLEYFSAWHHAVVREFVLLPDFEESPAWIASRIVPRITPEEARRSLELLQRIGYLSRDPVTGRLVQTHARISTPPGANHIAVIRYHQRMAELGKECLTRVKAARRDVNAVTVPMTPALFASLKEAIASLRKDALARAEALGTAAEDIYQLNLQLFPLTSAKEGKAK